jgi:glycogen debranching enzyme
LVQKFRSLDWDNSQLHDASPFRMVDPGFNAILLRACADLADLAEQLGETAIAEASRLRVVKGIAALDALWSEDHGQYLCFDRASGALVDSPSVAGILAAFAGIPADRAAAIAARVERLSGANTYLVPSHDPSDHRYDARRYWRGPVWLIVNYMIADGLARAGQRDIAGKITESSLELIRKSGFAEYYDPEDGTPCGGGQFSWTAAMVIEFLTAA